jgi:lysozyme
LDQSQFDALVSLVFNIGGTNFAHSTLLKKLNAHDYLGASAEFVKWNKAAGKPMLGLTRRRAAERDHFLRG